MILYNYITLYITRYNTFILESPFSSSHLVMMLISKYLYSSYILGIEVCDINNSE